MKKENKEMLRTIIRNQELIMKALKIEIPANEEKKALPQKALKKDMPAKKAVTKRPVKKGTKRK